jgi:chaperonin GroES
MKVQPLFDRVLITRLVAEEKTASGIILTAVDKIDMGDIIAVGDGKSRDNGEVRPMTVKVGDRVIFGEYSGQNVKVDGKEYLMMNESDIVGIVTEE